jgi:hypothetical protein
VTAPNVRRTIEPVWRIESARLIAGLARIVRDVGVAARGATTAAPYRDKECHAAYAAFRDSTIAPVIMLGCAIDLATQRRRGLRALYSLTAGRP